MNISKEYLSSVIEYTRVKGTDTELDVKKICDEAIKYNFAAICVNPFYVGLAHNILRGSKVEVCTGIGFPLGASTLDVKVKEIHEVARMGANAVDFVINYSALKSGMWNVVESEILALVKEVGEIGGLTSKVIIETCYLDSEEIYKVSQIAASAGVNYVKTNTGMGTRGASVEDVKIIREAVNNKCKIKASGGINSLQQVYDLLQAGASRIGTSKGVQILNELSNYGK